METIVVTNWKGGVGKTTVATHIAAGMAMIGFRVILVDTDPQGHCSLAFQQPKLDALYKLMTFNEDDFDIEDIIPTSVIDVPVEKYAPKDFTGGQPLKLLPSYKATAGIAVQNTDFFAFDDRMKAVGKYYKADVMIVDTSPTISMFDRSIYFAANYVLWVTEANTFSFDALTEGLRDVIKINNDNARHRPQPTRFLGVVPNKFRASTRNHRRNMEKLDKAFQARPEMPPIWSPVRLGTNWETATQTGQTVWSYAPESAEALEATQLVEQTISALQKFQAESAES